MIYTILERKGELFQKKKGKEKHFFRMLSAPSLQSCRQLDISAFEQHQNEEAISVIVVVK
jgi:hypothetical protein